jgi:hypothetical protein
MHTYIHTYIHTYTHTYIHTYIHTYTHTYNYTHGPVEAHKQSSDTCAWLLEPSNSWSGFAGDADKQTRVVSANHVCVRIMYVCESCVCVCVCVRARESFVCANHLCVRIVCVCESCVCESCVCVRVRIMCVCANRVIIAVKWGIHTTDMLHIQQNNVYHVCKSVLLYYQYTWIICFTYTHMQARDLDGRDIGRGLRRGGEYVLRRSSFDQRVVGGRKVLLDALVLVCDGSVVYTWEDALAWICASPICDVDATAFCSSSAHTVSTQNENACIGLDSLDDSAARLSQRGTDRLESAAKFDSLSSSRIQRDVDVLKLNAHVVGDGEGVHVTWASEIFQDTWGDVLQKINKCVADFLRLSDCIQPETETEQKRHIIVADQDGHESDQSRLENAATEYREIHGQNKKPLMQIVSVRMEVCATEASVRVVGASPGVDFAALRKARAFVSRSDADEDPMQRFGAWIG